MPRSIYKIVLKGAAAVQSVRTEIISDEEWTNVPSDEVLVIEKFGVYGAATASYGLLKNFDVIIPEGSKCQYTSFGGDISGVPDLNYAVPPGSSLRLYYLDAAADPAGLTLVIKGTIFKLAEL